MSASPVPRVILASASPRRRELLAGLGLDLIVHPVELDETPRPGEAPEPYVLRLAREKAVAARHGIGGRDAGESAAVLVLAADTVVAMGMRLLGKPADVADARRMLRELSGREHTVLTGVAVWDPTANRIEAGVESTRVRMAALTEREIAGYATSGEPLDKAGGYAIQGLGALWVEGIRGNYSNVVGLPLPLVLRLLRRLGYDLEIVPPGSSAEASPGCRLIRRRDGGRARSRSSRPPVP